MTMKIETIENVLIWNDTERTFTEKCEHCGSTRKIIDATVLIGDGKIQSISLSPGNYEKCADCDKS